MKSALLAVVWIKFFSSEIQDFLRVLLLSGRLGEGKMTADDYSEICPGLIESAGGLQPGRGFIFQHSSDPKQKVKTGLKDSEGEKASLYSNK